eukprot:Em0002g1060a
MSHLLCHLQFTSLAGITPLCQVNNLFDQIRNVNQRSSSKLLTNRRERKDVAHPLSPARETPDTLSHLEKRSLILFQGIAMPAFIANTSAEPIAMFEMPAFCNRDFRSSSLICISAHLVFTVLEQAAVVGCWLLLGSCIVPLSELVEMALFSNAAASLSSPAYILQQPQSSKDALWLMLLPAPQHTWCRPTYDMAVQGATTESLKRSEYLKSWRSGVGITTAGARAGTGNAAIVVKKGGSNDSWIWLAYSIVPRPLFPQLWMDYITAKRKEVM